MTVCVRVAYVVLFVSALDLARPVPLRAEPVAEQTLYWWQDELRTVAAELSRIRRSEVAAWPAMTVPAGAAAAAASGRRARAYRRPAG